MSTIGVDAHKRVHAATLPAPHQWGIEGAGQYGHGLAQLLVRTHASVVEVNPRLTAGMRRGGRARGKSDRLDALAVARVVQREGNALPAVQPDDARAVLAVLVADRDGALAEATSIRNHLPQQVHQLSAVDTRAWPELTDAAQVATLSAYPAPTADPVVAARASVVRRLAVRLELVLRQAAEARQAIETLARRDLGPLLERKGVAPLTAGMLAAALGGGQRFRSDAQLAS